MSAINCLLTQLRGILCISIPTDVPENCKPGPGTLFSVCVVFVLSQNFGSLHPTRLDPDQEIVGQILQLPRNNM